GIYKIDLPAKENVAVIRTPCDENQCGDESDLRQEREPPPHPPFKSAIRNPQSEILFTLLEGRAPSCPENPGLRPTGVQAAPFGLAFHQPLKYATFEFDKSSL